MQAQALEARLLNLLATTQQNITVIQADISSLTEAIKEADQREANQKDAKDEELIQAATKTLLELDARGLSADTLKRLGRLSNDPNKSAKTEAAVAEMTAPSQRLSSHSRLYLGWKHRLPSSQC